MERTDRVEDPIAYRSGPYRRSRVSVCRYLFLGAEGLCGGWRIAAEIAIIQMRVIHRHVDAEKPGAREDVVTV